MSLRRSSGRRRRVVIRDPSDVVAEIERLRSRHRTIGRWSLAQVSQHLADSFRGSIDGYDMRRHAWKRALIGKPLFWLTLRFGLPRGVTVDPALDPPPDVDVDTAVEAVRRAVGRYVRHTGPMAAHPIFGRLTRAQWDRLHCLHAAHHLSFVVVDG